MAFLPQLPRSLPVSAKQTRLILAVLGTLVVLQVLGLLPGSSPSLTGRAPVAPKMAPQPRRQEPEHVQKYLNQVLEDARKKASSPQNNRKARQDQKKQANGRDGQARLDGTSTNGNTLVLATHLNQAALGVLAIRHKMSEDAAVFLPGVSTGQVKTWLPSDSDWLADAKATADINGLVQWIDTITDNLANSKPHAKTNGKRLGDAHGGIGGVVLGSCEKDLPLLTPSLLKLHGLLPSTLRFPVACILSDPSAFLASSASALPEWTSSSVLGRWAQLGTIRVLAPGTPLTIASLSAHFTRLSLHSSLSSLAYEHIPVSSFVPSLPLPQMFKRAAWREGKKMFGGGSQGIKRQGKKPTLVDAGVVDDGSSSTSYEALFKSLEAELDVAPASWGYLKPASKSDAFSPDPSPKSRSQFILHVVLPPPAVIPWPTPSTTASHPPVPVIPKRLEQVVQVHWDWKATAEETIQTQFWKVMDELDILLLAQESIPDQLPLSLPLSLSLSIPLLYPSSPLDLSTSFPFAIAKPHALPTFSAVRLLRTGTGDGVEMGTHWTLRREVLALLERGWAWKQQRKGAWREDNWLAVIEALG